MYMNCITNTPIPWDEKVKLLFICPESKNYSRGLQTENSFSIIGLAFDAVYDEKMRFIVEQKDNKNYNYSLNRLKEMNEGLDVEVPKNSYRNIESLIFKGKIKIKIYGEETFVNTMVIKETVFNSLLSDDSIKLNREGNFEEYKKNQIENFKELILLKETDLIKFSVKYSTEYRDFFRMFNINPKTSLDIMTEHFEDFLKNIFVLKFLEEQGYYIVPSQEHNEGNNKTDFLEELIKIQVDKERESLLSFKEIEV